MMESTFFKVAREGAVARLTMARPDKANAMSAEFWADLPRLTRALAAEPEVRVIVITGEGRHFSSGMDLSAFSDIADMTSDEPGRAALALREHILKLQDTFTALERARVPVICAIHGACIGGAIDMITAADIRLCAANSYFSVEEIHIGMAADVGTLQRLPKLIPPGAARELALTGRRFDAAEARALGLVSSVHEDKDAVEAAAMDMAHLIAGKSPLAIAGIKQSLNFARDHTVTDGLDQIATWNAGMLRPKDLMKAMQARMAKKEAVFKDLRAS